MSRPRRPQAPRDLTALVAAVMIASGAVVGGVAGNAYAMQEEAAQVAALEQLVADPAEWQRVGADTQLARASLARTTRMMAPASVGLITVFAAVAGGVLGAAVSVLAAGPVARLLVLPGHREWMQWRRAQLEAREANERDWFTGGRVARRVAPDGDAPGA